MKGRKGVGEQFFHIWVLPFFASFFLYPPPSGQFSRQVASAEANVSAWLPICLLTSASAQACRHTNRMYLTGVWLAGSHVTPIIRRQTYSDIEWDGTYRDWKSSQVTQKVNTLVCRPWIKNRGLFFFTMTLSFFLFSLNHQCDTTSLLRRTIQRGVCSILKRQNNTTLMSSGRTSCHARTKSMNNPDKSAIAPLLIDLRAVSYLFIYA